MSDPLERSLEQIMMLGDAAEVLKSNIAWKEIQEIVKDKIEAMNMQRYRSVNPNVHLACNKEENGIRFISDALDELISEGLEAGKQLGTKK